LAPGSNIRRLAECFDELVVVSQPALVPEEQQSFPPLLRYSSFEPYEAARILAPHGVDSLISQPRFLMNRLYLASKLELVWRQNCTATIIILMVLFNAAWT